MSTTSAAVPMTVTGGVNAPPTVSLTAPANGALFTTPASIALAATASDSDGIIQKVEFFNGTALLGISTSAPYSFNWNNVSAGSYTLTAKATDSFHAATVSAPVTVTVNDVPPPTGLSQVTFVAAGPQVTSTGATITPLIPAAAQYGDFAVVVLVGRPGDICDPSILGGKRKLLATMFPLV